jgi:hypothetical protein
LEKSANLYITLFSLSKAAGRVAQVVESLCSKHEALSSRPSTAKKKKKKKKAAFETFSSTPLNVCYFMSEVIQHQS